MSYNEDTLVQQTTADYLRDQLGWESIYAYNNEDFGMEIPVHQIRKQLKALAEARGITYEGDRRWRRYRLP